MAAAATQDIKTLKKISARVQMAKDGDLETVVRESLCDVILKLGLNAPVEREHARSWCWMLGGRCWQARNEALVQQRDVAATELLSLVNELITDHKTWKLKGVAEELLGILRTNCPPSAFPCAPDSSDVVLMELSIAINRCSLAELRSLAGHLTTGIASEAGHLRTALLHLAFFSLASYSTSIQDFAGDNGSLPTAFTDPKAVRAQDQGELLRFGLNVMLLHCSGSQSEEPTTSAEGDACPPPGLRISDAEEISHAPAGVPLDGTRSFHNKKLGLLNLCAICDNFPAGDVALIALASTDDSNIEVASTAEYVLETRCSPNGVLCCNELEDEGFVERVFELLAGSPEGVPHHLCKRAAASSLRIRLYRLCCMSVTACNLSPRTLEVVRASVEDIVDPRDCELQQVACDFVVWVLQNSNEDVVAAVVPPILEGAIYSLNLLTVAAPTPSLPVRRLLYQAVGHIAERSPQAFKGDVTTAAGFFGKLQTEPYTLFASVNDTVSRMVCAYTALPCADTNEELQCMLKWQAEGSNERARTCAIVWALTIWPMDSELHKRIEFLSADNSASVSHQPTKLFEPDSHKHKAVASNSGASFRHAEELRRGWPEAWAAMQQEQEVKMKRIEDFSSVSTRMSTAAHSTRESDGTVTDGHPGSRTHARPGFQGVIQQDHELKMNEVQGHGVGTRMPTAEHSRSELEADTAVSKAGNQEEKVIAWEPSSAEEFLRGWHQAQPAMQQDTKKTPKMSEIFSVDMSATSSREPLTRRSRSSDVQRIMKSTVQRSRSLELHLRNVDKARMSVARWRRKELNGADPEGGLAPQCDAHGNPQQCGSAVAQQPGVPDPASPTRGTCSNSYDAWFNPWTDQSTRGAPPAAYQDILAVQYMPSVFDMLVEDFEDTPALHAPRPPRRASRFRGQGQNKPSSVKVKPSAAGVQGRYPAVPGSKAATPSKKPPLRPPKGLSVVRRDTE